MLLQSTQKLLASILKNGIPTFGFFKCLKLLKFFFHDTCRVSGFKNKQIFTRCKALEGRLTTFGCLMGFALLGLYSNKACRPTQKSSSPPTSCLGNERFSGFTTFGRIIGFALLGLYSNKVCRPTQKSSPPTSCLGKERFSIEKTLTTFKCPCSTWTVDFQHLKNLNALIEHFRFIICFFQNIVFRARECLSFVKVVL